MNTKLTLRLNEEVIERAKAYAKDYNMSLSKLIEAYLDQLTRRSNKAALPLTPLVKSLHGVGSLPEGFEEKESYYDFLMEKHGEENGSKSIR